MGSSFKYSHSSLAINLTIHTCTYICHCVCYYNDPPPLSIGRHLWWTRDELYFLIGTLLWFSGRGLHFSISCTHRVACMHFSKINYLLEFAGELHHILDLHNEMSSTSNHRPHTGEFHTKTDSYSTQSADNMGWRLLIVVELSVACLNYYRIGSH